MSKILQDFSADSFIRLIEGNNDDLRKLLYIIPDAETLVKYVTKFRDEKHDIMDKLVAKNKIEAFDKIIKIYFGENTEKNNRLRREFITSHAPNQPAKDFHYFYQYFSPKYKKGIQAMLTPSEKLKQKILQAEMPDYTITDEIAQKLNFYSHLRAAYFDAITKASHTKLIKNAQENTAQETYPRIRLSIIPENQKDGGYKNFDIHAAYDAKKHDLARKVFHSMPFPDIWIKDEWRTGAGYFNYLNELDKSYHQIKEKEPVVFSLLKNFQQNDYTIILENTINPMNKTNVNLKVEYDAYTYSHGIGFRCDRPYEEESLRHELTHIIGDFENTDIYRFSTIPLGIDEKKSQERYIAVEESHAAYPNSQYLRESLARIIQFKKYSQGPDPLLDETRNLFFIYADAKTEDRKGIINRINLCARRRLLGYTQYETAYNKLNNYYDACEAESPSKETIKSCEEEYGIACTKLIKQACKGEKFNLNILEENIIQCIKQEIATIKAIKKEPNADRIVLNIDILERDNVTDNPPLEVLVAKTIKDNKRLFQMKAGRKSAEELQEGLNTYAALANQNFQELQKESQGIPLKNSFRTHYLEGVAAFYKGMVFAHALIKKYNPQHNPNDYDINSYVLDEHTIQDMNRAIYNLELLNSQNPDIKLSPEYMKNPFAPIKDAFEQADKIYETIQTGDRRTRAQNLFSTLKELCHAHPKDLQEEIKNLRLMQLIYRKMNPTAKELPKELRFDSLNLKDFIPTEQTDRATLPELTMSDQKKEEKLKKLKIKYKYQQEIYEKFERGYNQTNDNQPNVDDKISPCTKVIKHYAQKFAHRGSPAKIKINATDFSK